MNTSVSPLSRLKWNLTLKRKNTIAYYIQSTRIHCKLVYVHTLSRVQFVRVIYRQVVYNMIKMTEIFKKTHSLVNELAGDSLISLSISSLCFCNSIFEELFGSNGNFSLFLTLLRTREKESYFPSKTQMHKTQLRKKSILIYVPLIFER